MRGSTGLWVICAVLMSIAFFCQGVPLASQGGSLLPGVSAAEAQKRVAKKKTKRKSRERAIGRCVRYRQQQTEEGLYLRLANRCDFDLSCTMSWRVRCDSDEPGTRRRKAEVLEIDQGTTDGTYASAAICGDDGWRISEVRWSCEDAAE
jgi:hypothetical protein